MRRRTWFCLFLVGALLLPAAVSTPGLAQSHVYYVTVIGYAFNDCTGWARACDLQKALTLALSGDEIWVAEGTYFPTSDGNRSASFALKSGVGLYGGFAGVEASRDERNWQTHPTVLSGDLNGDDGPGFVNNDENGYHVVTSSGVDASAVLDGFTITGGHADGGWPDNNGGGLFNQSGSPTVGNVALTGNTVHGNGAGMWNYENASPTLTNCTFSGNVAGMDAGGMYNYDHSSPVLADCTFSGNHGADGGGMYNFNASSPSLTNCTFTSNSADDDGGGMYNYNNASPDLTNVIFDGNSASQLGGGMVNTVNSSPTLTSVTFKGNLAFDGGGMYSDASSPAVTNSSFSGNLATNYGGGMYNSSSAPALTNCTFLDNSANYGGGIFNGASSPALTDVTFSGNAAASVGGGMCNYYFSSPALTDVTFSGNSAAQGGGMYNDHSSPTISGCDFSTNLATNYGGGILNAFSSPVLTDVTFSRNSATQGGGGVLNTSSSSPALTNCTFSANSATYGGGMYNLASSPAVSNCTFSGNSATQGGGLHNSSSSPVVTNCILWGDSPGEISDDGSTPVVTYSDVQGGYAGTGNIDSDPLLGQPADNGGPTRTCALRGDSPARDAGDPDGCRDASGHLLTTDQRGMVRPWDGDGDGVARCDMGAFEARAANDAWTRAQILDLSGGPATAEEYVDQLGQSRWYKFQVTPGSRVTAHMVPANVNLDIALYGDIQAAYDGLTAPAGEADLLRLNAEFAADALSPFAYSPFAYSPFAYSPFAYSPFAYSPFAYSPFAYSPFAYSPFAYSPFAYSPFAYSPFAYSPFAYSPFAYSADPDYSSAQMRTLMAISAFEGTASETIEANTWDKLGWFYVQVSGRNGAYDVSDPFTLQVSLDLGICEGVYRITRPAAPTALNEGYQVIFVTDWSRFDQADPNLAALQSTLPLFAQSVGGTVVDVGQDAYVWAANGLADLAPQCPYAKNQVAGLIKEIVEAYRDAGNPIEYVVLVGSDQVIPFFRYPDRAELGSEKDYKPPVLEGTASYASLTLGYVLSQDAYGSSVDLSLSTGSLPVPDLAVGRLVETPADILNMLEVYTQHGGTLAPASALVTGYDFLADAANAIESELGAGLGVQADALVTPDEISPQDRDGAPPLDAPWTAPMLREALLGSRHDLIFLAGHFTAQGALAADYETRLWTSDLLDSSANLENALVYSAGCHSGYNTVNEHGVPYVTVEPDWAQAFAQAGATFVGGTGYQYGDTDFLEYSERLYLEFTRELRCSEQPQSVGQALVQAKQDYLSGTAQMRGIHEKALLEATLFGLPMLQVSGLSNAGCPVDPGSIVGSTQTYTAEPGDPATPGEILQLRYADVTVASSLTQNTVALRNVVEPETYMDATYFSGTNGAVTSPAEPVLPLERRNVDVAGYVLRGIGFRGGRFTDLSGKVPLTGGATTETRAANTPFQSDIPYPLRPWSANYFAELANPDGGVTWLDVTAAQFMSDGDGNPWTGTWRRYDDMEFRLFYSNQSGALDGGAVPSLAGPPAILKALATSGTDGVYFQIRVAGDVSAGVQEVWITYTGMPCSGGGTCWQSLDLTQKLDDSTLWEGMLPTAGVPTSQIQYMVQAANGVGLVSLATNEGMYYQVDVDPAEPAEPAGDGEPANPPESTSVELQSPPSEGTFSGEATFRAVLKILDGTPLEGQTLAFALGAQQRRSVTDGTGVATATFPLNGVPGEYSVSVAFPGSLGYAPSSTVSPFTVLKQVTALTFLENAGTAQYSDDAAMKVRLAGADGGELGEMPVLFLISGEGQAYAVAGVTDFRGEAVPSRVTLPMGSYTIEAHFGEAVMVNGQVVDLSDPYRGGSSASGTLEVLPEDTLVTYTGDTIVPDGSTTLNMAATVSQADDGSPGDLFLAWVQFDVWDQSGNWMGDQRAQAGGDGSAVATLAGLEPGMYQVRVTVYGGYFASDPAPQMTAIDLPLDPVAVNTPVPGSALFIDGDSYAGHAAIWDWGDGTTCDTSVGGGCTLAEPSGSTPGTVTGSHAYAEPGVYTVRLTVTDGDGYTAEAIYEYVVVYSPAAGFVTGGGWITSQPGWCRLDDECAAASGKANFGFVSRYKQGANRPTGTTEFNFSAGGLNFHSESYDWLVVNQGGTNAQFKGSGTVNGAVSPSGDPYKFMLWARDGGPEGEDTFRIKIWWEEAGAEILVYDNGFDQPIGGGSIVIHTGK